MAASLSLPEGTVISLVNLVGAVNWGLRAPDVVTGLETLHLPFEQGVATVAVREGNNNPECTAVPRDSQAGTVTQ